MSILDVSARYALTKRTSVIASLPIVTNRFSMLFPPLGSPLGVRHGWNANGIGDLSLYTQTYLLNGKEHPFSNVALGLGMKIPTGNWNVQGYLPNENGLGFRERAVYPPAVMPGDGGTAIIVGVSGFKTFRTPQLLRGNTVFYSANYLINPRNTNGTASIIQNLGVPLAPQFLGGLTNSVTDSWNIQVGTSIKLPKTWDKPRWKNLRGRVTYGWQGIPEHDLFGKSGGFRQAGYVMSIAPGATYAYGHGYFIVEVPITFNAYVNPQATAIPGLPVKTPSGLQPAPFNLNRNLGLIAPVAVAVRYVRSF